MSKTITVEELAANVRKHIAEVEGGETLTITQEGRAIATIGPAVRIVNKGKPFPFRDFDPGPRPKNLKTDPAQIVIDERDYERNEKKWRP